MMAGSSRRLHLPEVTLCAATSVNVKATVRAMEASLAQVDFAACKLFTDADVRPRDPRIRIIPIPRIRSAAAYSDFMLLHMVDHIDTSHCLVVQWDGFVTDARRWRPTFLDYDYIGAGWPQFDDGYDVGNGGFSLRSRRLMEAFHNPDFQARHPEDVAIGRINRPWLEGRGLHFAPRSLADDFSAERAGDPERSFGFHGVWHMPHIMGATPFWDIYRDLDDRSTVRHDFSSIMKAMGREPGSLGRIGRMTLDLASHRLRGYWEGLF
jgi:hypothetical protein